MFLYNIVVRGYGFLIWLSSLKSNKAALWINGRKHWRSSLTKDCAGLGEGTRVWVHCASYGEFEQGRPLIEAIRAQHPDYKIILSFFSPSGYEAFKNWPGANLVCYLPLDTKRNARDFINTVNPQLAVFIKYEFWVNFLFCLQQKGIPGFLVSAVFKPHHPFFKWYGGLFRKSLKTFTRLFIQDEASGNLLKSIGINTFEISGDTRFDRVMLVKSGNTKNTVIEAFKADNKLIMAGSTWPGDEDLILDAFKNLKDKGVKLMLAPHEIDPKFISNTVKRIEERGFTYSLFTNEPKSASDVLVLNTMGMLAKSYAYADCAYIGGGFNSGIHNLLEPAVFGIGITFYGTKFERFNEAVDMVASGAAINVNSPGELIAAFDKQLFDPAYRQSTATTLQGYFKQNADATGRILKAINLQG